MSFVQGKCENCGGILTVDPSLKAANCPFCGVAYVVQDSINNYNTTIKVESMHANVVNVSDESSSEGRLKAGDAYMKLGKFDQAEAEYKKVTELTPQNYRGWLGLIEACTFNYTKRIKSNYEINKIREYAKTIQIINSGNNDNGILSIFDAYINAEIAKNNQEIEELNKRKSQNTEKLNELEIQKQQLKRQFDDLRRKYSRRGSYRMNKALAIILFVLGGILLFSGLSWLMTGMDPNIPAVITIIVFGVIAIAGGIILIVKNKSLGVEILSIAKDIKELPQKIKRIEKQQEPYRSAIKELEKEMEAYNSIPKSETNTGATSAAPAVNTQVRNRQKPQQPQPDISLIYPDLPKPGPDEALLVVECKASNPNGSVTITTENNQQVTVKDGEKSVLKVNIGSNVIRYLVDKGTYVTVIASRRANYTKELDFHPGETIVMQVNIGKEHNRTLYQSSLGTKIV